MNILEMKPHPLAAAMPRLAKHEAEALEKSMKSQGFDARDPIVVWHDPKLGEDRILDGVNRRDTAKRLGITQIHWTRFNGEYKDAAAWVAYRQLGRRSPDPSQRAGIMATFRKFLDLDIESAAQTAGVSVSQMEKACAVANKSKVIANKVIAGELTVNKAARKLKRTTPETHTPGEDPWIEIERTRDKITAAENALAQWAEDYLDPILDRRGAEMLRANLASRQKSVAGKKVLGLAMIEEMVQTLKRNKPKAKCPLCHGVGCQECGDRRYVTAHELAMNKNAERSGK